MITSIALVLVSVSVIFSSLTIMRLEKRIDELENYVIENEINGHCS